ncbi:MAG TPA: succinate dehydrogenase, cytochrome b556 subunit [Steroidobacteraceae bacterium]|jgi:succinate dehydrogenase / fumarate reductase cytochrome b subunit
MPTSVKRQLPLSPFLTVYRWQYTMTLSIMHRITGCALSVGALLLVYWLIAIASGPEAYDRALAVFAHPITRIVLVVFSYAFFYHLLNGIRHLVWDSVHWLERREARLSGWIVFIASVIVTLLFWVVVLSRDAGGAV